MVNVATKHSKLIIKRNVDKRTLPQGQEKHQMYTHSAVDQSTIHGDTKTGPGKRAPEELEPYDNKSPRVAVRIKMKMQVNRKQKGSPQTTKAHTKPQDDGEGTSNQKKLRAEKQKNVSQKSYSVQGSKEQPETPQSSKVIQFCRVPQRTPPKTKGTLSQYSRQIATWPATTKVSYKCQAL